MCTRCDAAGWAERIREALRLHEFPTSGVDFLTSVSDWARTKGHLSERQIRGVENWLRNARTRPATPAGTPEKKPSPLRGGEPNPALVKPTQRSGSVNTPNGLVEIGKPMLVEDVPAVLIGWSEPKQVFILGGIVNGVVRLALREPTQITNTSPLPIPKYAKEYLLLVEAYERMLDDTQTTARAG